MNRVGTGVIGCGRSWKRHILRKARLLVEAG